MEIAGEMGAFAALATGPLSIFSKGPTGPCLEIRQLRVNTKSAPLDAVIIAADPEAEAELAKKI